MEEKTPRIKLKRNGTPCSNNQISSFSSESYPNTRRNYKPIPFTDLMTELRGYLEDTPERDKKKPNREIKESDVIVEESNEIDNVLNTTIIENDRSENDLFGIKYLNNTPPKTVIEKSINKIKVVSNTIKVPFKQKGIEVLKISDVKTPKLKTPMAVKTVISNKKLKETIKKPVSMKKIEFHTPMNSKKPDNVLREKNTITNNRHDTKPKQEIQFSMPMPSKSFQNKNFETLTICGKQYIIVSKLGEGGSSQVFNCIDSNSLQLRAVKVVNLSFDATTMNGYIDEVKMLQSLQDSEHVIKMYDFELTKKTLFVVLEKGEMDLSVFLRNITTKSSKLRSHVINYYWMEMLDCVQEIHKNGIIHSDLKPSNFIIVGGGLKLIDFGISSRLTSDMTSLIKNVYVGTFSYLSPEALHDSRDSNSPNADKPRIRISYKSDVWSLGCILYQLVYHRTPFQKYGNPMAKVAMITDRNHQIEYPEVRDDLVKFITIIKKCLQYDMKLRPTVLELLIASGGFL